MISTKGRRGRPPFSTRIRAEECAQLDACRLGHGDPLQFLPIAETLLHSHRMPDPSRDNLQEREVEVFIEGPGAASMPVRLTVTATRPHFGGIRQWFRCPQCGRRVRKLYCREPHSGLACRRCLRLLYRSQFEKNELLVAWRRQMRLLRRIRPDLYRSFCASGVIQPL